ncbi:MAG: phosphoenolpyruvate kinase, partial [Acidobacteriota bacterium]|nr:phosphoenolpyruvate kinase [Acidobacteriota bacterium]
MRTTLTLEQTREITSRLRQVNLAFAERYPGEAMRRQPVHTVYGGAHLFKADSAQRLGRLALQSLEQYAPNYAVFARAINLPGSAQLPSAVEDDAAVRSLIEKDSDALRRENYPVWLAHTIYTRVVEKLRREPVEDFRIDFEDGYGNRPDAEEDGHAEAAAQEVVAGLRTGTLPPFIGIRIKPFTEELFARSLRTLDIFVSTLVEHGGRLPPNFVVTLPKITVSEQVAALVSLFDRLEESNGLAHGTLKMEMMIETTQSIINQRGESSLPILLEAARGRCVAAHFGTYDYTASCQITAAHQ